MNTLTANPAHETRELLGTNLETTVSSMAVQIARAELDQAVVTARNYPRSIDRTMRNILTLATLSEKTATDCVYALPRAGKAIRGPSVRLAEIIAQQWGNCHVGSRILGVDHADKVVVAEGVFHDLETGMKRISQVRRKITDRHGKLFNEDMIVVTGNAAASIAMREAVLKGVPRGIWEEAYERCESVIRGDVKTLTERRDAAFKAFAAFGVTPEQIFAYLEVEGEKDITLDHLATLTATHSAIKSGEAAVEEYFSPSKAKPATRDRKQRATSEAGPSEKKAAPEEKPVPGNAEANAKKTGEAAEKKPAPDAKPEPENKPDPTLAAHQATYDRVVQDTLDANNIDKPLVEHADAIDAMQKEAPTLYRQLMEELDAFAAGDDTPQNGDQGSMKV